MTELEKFEAVRATVLVIWLEVMSGHVDLSKLRELCLESLAQPEGNGADAMMLNLVDQLIAHSVSDWASLAAFSARPNGADLKRISDLLRGSVHAGVPCDLGC